MAKLTDEEDVSIEFNGKTFYGKRVIEGTRKRTQTIYYGSHSKYDGHGYRPGEDAYMEGIAKIMLRELIEEHPDG